MDDRFKFRLPAINTKTGYVRMAYFDFSTAGAACTVFPPYWNVRPIEQCTGLKDKTGRLIYEGDVIELTRTRRYLSRGDKLLVKYDTDRYCGFGFSGGHALTKKCAENCIIIGNIHENPKLLEAEK